MYEKWDTNKREIMSAVLCLCLTGEIIAYLYTDENDLVGKEN